MADSLQDDDDLDWDDDTLDEEDETLGALPEDTSDPSPAATPDRADLEQKLRSAEGRYQKSEETLKEFQTSIDTMRQQLASLTPAPTPEDAPDSEDPPADVVPDGWTQDEWNDYKDDQPVTAELQEQQIRQVQKIREDLDTQRDQQQAQVFHDQFRSTVLAAHPDFDALLSEKGTLEKFIENQTNPLLKQAYQTAFNHGTAEDVVHLISDFKQARPSSGQAQSSKAEEAIAVTGRSSQPNVSHTGRVDPDDFDAAWEAFPDDMDD